MYLSRNEKSLITNNMNFAMKLSLAPLSPSQPSWPSLLSCSESSELSELLHSQTVGYADHQTLKISSFISCNRLERDIYCLLSNISTKCKIVPELKAAKTCHKQYSWWCCSYDKAVLGWPTLACWLMEHLI